jgi:indole-3-glycerol phosphate synthase
MTTLERILAEVRQNLARRREEVPLDGVLAQAERQEPALDFAASLAQPGISLIAEVKRASPSRGLLAPEFDPLRLARLYATNGARAISVLTEPHFFQGSLQYLEAIRREVPLPLLCKDFILDRYQVCEARAHGADAILLIASILTEEELAALLQLGRSLGMEALVEVHDEEELEKVLGLAPRVVGINNRNLHTFHVDLATSFLLRSLVPDGILTVSESGIETRAQVERLARMGFDAVLVGGALVEAEDVSTKVKELAGMG